MGVRFIATPGAEGVGITAEETSLLSRRALPPTGWASLPGIHGSAARVLAGLIERSGASLVAGSVLLQNGAAAGLPSSIAEAIGMPPVARLSATLSFDGRIDSSDGRIRIRWYDPDLHTVLASRTGPILFWGEERGRLSKDLFDLLEAVDAFNGSEGAATDHRIACWHPVQACLRRVGAEVNADGYLGSLTIHQAGAFALDVRETTEGPDFLPVLMARSKAISLEDEAPVGAEADGEDEPSAEASLRNQEADALLSPELQEKFVKEHFACSAVTRSAYVLGRNQFIVLDPDLKIALDVVRQKRSAPAEERRAFVRNPRPAIVEAIGNEGADLTAASLFVETEQYSERVLGLGLWDPPKLPWLKRKVQQWLPESFRVTIGDRVVTLTPQSLDALMDQAEAARQDGIDQIQVENIDHPLAEVEDSLAKFLSKPAHTDGEPVNKADISDEEITPDNRQEALQIADNFVRLEFEVDLAKRHAALPPQLPLDQLQTAAKPHQQVGFHWLVNCWVAGLPGVLLADDMGLGKTWQALAFLAWIRLNRTAARASAKKPILIVAPTALLRNWEAEAERHLAAEALGKPLLAYGSGLARLKRSKSAGWTPEDALDVEALRDADWILTTYETLADNHRAFARVAFSVAVFDEMQKVKAPGTINTHAAKTLNADFVLGLTGTPIENRLEDLWCIMDRVAPGYLGDLKTFSSKYADENQDALKALKAKLDAPEEGALPIMLRRMKETILEGLPAKTVKSYPIPMPPAQAEAYGNAVQEAQSGARTQGAMLKAINTFRGISLSPDGARDVDGYDARSIHKWVGRSARLQQVIDILRCIEQRNEKALVFVEDRAVQSAFAACASTLFGLRAEPAIINGAIPGSKRQAIVDRFQGGLPGFDLLVLSPKAAGVGLTITAANHVIHLSRWWNPAVEDQCNDRVYRIGQDKDVTVHVPIAIHPEYGDASFDVTLDRLLQSKRKLSRHMLAPPVSESDVGVLFGAAVGDPAVSAHSAECRSSQKSTSG